MNSGDLVPFFTDEILPGDQVTVQTAVYARMATALKPYMDGIHIDWQFFFTPTRLVWDNFTKMMGERIDPADHNDYTVPQQTGPAGSGYLSGSLSDYLGLPIEVPDQKHSALFHRCYSVIFDAWYRDENLTDSIKPDLGDGPDDPTDNVIQTRSKRKDYFTSALLTAQKGDPVSISLGGTAPVVSTGNVIDWNLDNEPPINGPMHNKAVGNSEVFFTSGGANNSGDFSFGADTGLEADLGAATAISINSMRQALGIQHLLERDSRGGTRYRETILSHWGIHTDDIRLRRPELLSTGTAMVNVHPVADTAGALSGKVADLSAYATAASVGRGWTKSFTEHGILMGICSIRADLSYQQGMPRMFSRLTRYDHFWPDLAGLGEEVIRSREIFSDGTGDETLETGDWAVWGYQPRYESYRNRLSQISGVFRSADPLSLDIWHLAQDFATRPVLNDAFIKEDVPIARIVIVNDPIVPEFLMDCFHKVRHTRHMPRFGVPGLTRF